jgi:hypothetical protein
LREAARSSMLVYAIPYDLFHASRVRCVYGGVKST